MSKSNSLTFRTDRLVQRRRDLHLQSQELAALCGISPIQMSRIECGRRGVTVDMLVKLAHHLDCSTDYLLGVDTPEIGVLTT